MTQKKLLILDLDETLVHAIENPFNHSYRVWDFQLGIYYIYYRPFLREFIEFCLSHFAVAVWTASTQSYAQPIIEQIIPLDKLVFLWARERCTLRFDSHNYHYYYIQDLKKVKRKGYALQQVLIIDDTPRNLSRQYGNLIPVKPFYGDPEDNQLRLLMSYLPALLMVENVRHIEKRHWFL